MEHPTVKRMPEAVSHWSMTTLRNRLVKIGAKIVRHGRSITFQIAEVMVWRGLFQQILDAIAASRPYVADFSTAVLIRHACYGVSLVLILELTSTEM